MKVLVVDIGGTHVKILATGQKEPCKLASGPTLTAQQMVCEVRKAARKWSYDVVSIGKPPAVYPSAALQRNHMRLRVSPDCTSALGMMVIFAGQKMAGQAVEMLACTHPGAGEMDAYERVLGDAMAGDPTLFAREDYVEEAWRIVDPVLKANTPLSEYEPGGWGPPEVEQRVAPPGGWHNPVVTGQPGRGEVVQAA